MKARGDGQDGLGQQSGQAGSDRWPRRAGSDQRLRHADNMGGSTQENDRDRPS